MIQKRERDQSSSSSSFGGFRPKKSFLSNSSKGLGGKIAAATYPKKS